MSKFSKFQTKLTETEFNAAVNKGGSGGKKESKVFQPGLYDVVIKSCEDKGPSKLDDSWLNYELVLEGPGGKTIRTWLSIPTQDIASPILDGRYTHSTFNRLEKFAAALGIELRHDNVAEVLERHFENPNNLVGMHIQTEIGYKGPHAVYVKDENGTGFQLVDKNNSPMTDEIFDSRDAVAGYVSQQSWAKSYKNFPDVIGYKKSDVKNDLSGSGSTTGAKRISGLSLKDLG